jgi:aminopeptidase N
MRCTGATTILATASAVAGLASAVAAQPTTTQLPRTVRPSHYDIAIAPDAQRLTFAGKASIDVDVIEPTSAVTLNALDLDIDAVRVSAAGDASYVPKSVTADRSAETLTFTFAKPLAKGSYRLAIDYRGKINTQANGLFAIDYDTPAGAKRALFTQFEAADARRFVPSWDEPAYKATFSLEATVPSGLMAVGNMPVAETVDLGAGRARVRFAETPKMSTYLLFFGLGRFDRITARVGGTEVGVVTQRGLGDQGRFTLRSAADILREYDDYFGIPYPLPKLDNIASPGRSQFFSAMENWGAIFTFEHAILLNPAIETEADRHNAFGVAAHEMAHQWFGDLVTMGWWDDIWLNEGFATWMAGRTAEKLHPEWNTALDHVDGREAAMARDSLATTHPVVQHVATVEQASQAFDSITYQKGAAVIRMLERYVGQDAWRDGVRRYLRKHAYGNAVTDDLWREVEAAARQPVLAIAHDFTLQPGVPLLRVGEPECVNGKTTLTFTQGEFSEDRPDRPALAWRVPVIVEPLGAKDTVRVLVEGGSGSVSIPGCDPVIVNAGQSGYYRTLYSPPHFARIKGVFPKIATIDQLGILRDTWSLGMSGYRSAADVLDLASVTPTDADPKVWGTLADVLDEIDDLYPEDQARRETFRDFAIGRLAPAFARVGWTARAGESDSIAILRQRLIRSLSVLGDRSVIAEAQRRYAASATNPAAVPPSLRKTILAVVARHADGMTWERLHAAAKGEKTALIKDQLYALLASSEDAGLARRALEMSLTDEPGATNSAAMIARVSNLHPDLAFDFAMAHLSAVDAKVDNSARSSFYAGLASGSFDPRMIGKVTQYADAHLPPGARRSADTAIARIQYRIKARRERLPEIDAWLERQADSVTVVPPRLAAGR